MNNYNSYTVRQLKQILKEKTKEKNNALDPDLSDKQEQKADDFEKFHTPYKPRRR